MSTAKKTIKCLIGFAHNFEKQSIIGKRGSIIIGVAADLADKLIALKHAVEVVDPAAADKAAAEDKKK